ncbi:MAG: HAMP domain-containing histidine kinase, partial [Clostridia bacterium]|nr:HAMP domain-containing histidine kinase [Clostridia bacterium]
VKIKEIDIKYKPKHLDKRFLFLSIGAILLNVIVFLFCSAVHAVDFFLAGAIFLIVADAVFVVFAMKYFKNLDKIITAGQNGESADFGSEKVPESLNTLNDIIRVNNSRVKAAVEEAVKNERTKTELITNVSHDLKTPLTSIISYVELLKGEKLGNEQAKQYVDILGEKANSLKKLIENLVEASKVSAGNVKLNKTVINLKELVLQAEIEYQAEFENRNLDLRFNENCDAVNVFADGTQTYRVLENLLSNAKKYSSPGTRVYSSIRKDGNFGVFEIKNISSEPLDISPQELTERFVRGDASRGKEDGNGLGLSIAKELCALQNGRLEITIDGDLFKAEVYLPLQE